MNNQSANDECCPKFNSERWDEKTFNWENKPFIKESLQTFFHIPFPPMVGRKITRMYKMSGEAKMMPADKGDILVLFTDPSPFKSEIYLSVNGDISGAENVKISGAFMSKVFDGSYNAVPKFMKQMDEYLAGKNKKAKKYYIHYAYCPKCAKKYGSNYMIFFAEV
jgi:hypothetical protein